MCSSFWTACLSRTAARGSKCSAHPKWADCLSKVPKLPQHWRGRAGLLCDQSLVLSCPSTEFFLMDFKYFQNEWAKFPGTEPARHFPWQQNPSQLCRQCSAYRIVLHCFYKLDHDDMYFWKECWVKGFAFPSCSHLPAARGESAFLGIQGQVVASTLSKGRKD